MNVNSRASLRIALPGDQRGLVTRVLGEDPASEKLVTSRSVPGGVATCWVKRSGLEEKASIEEHLEALLELLEGREEALAELGRAGAEMDIFLGVFLRDLQGGFSISASLMRRLAQLELVLDFDIYGE